MNTTVISNCCPVSAAPGKADELEKALSMLATLTRLEAGNICYRIHKVNGKVGEFMIYEQWKDASALDHHMRQQYLIDFLADREHLLAREIIGTQATEI